MIYSSAGILALIVSLIINHDVLRNEAGKALIPAHRTYRRLLNAIMVYYITDILWGVFYEQRMLLATFIDTSIYFVAMACSVLFWTRYVIVYLKEENLFGKILTLLGWSIFVFQLGTVVVNFLLPVLFSFDEAGVYHAEIARYITLVVQTLMFLMTAIHALTAAAKRSGTMRLRYRTMGFFSLAMAGFIIGQAYFPLLPLYAIGCLLATCVLHSFVLENEKEEYRDALEARLQENILKGNYYDLLTGLPGMSYFFELAQRRRARVLETGGKGSFLFLNLSGMKFFNKSNGFAEGDRLLRRFAQLLISAFGSESCSRFGQDHFAVFTEQEDIEQVLRGVFRDWEASNDGDCPAIRAGVYPDTLPDTDVSTACDLAKVACDALRNTYVSSLRFFDTDMLVNAERQQYIVSHIDQAVAEGWIQVYYQPIVRAVNGRVCNEEALARWIDPERGSLSPSEFIPILEDANLVYKLDLCVVEQVLKKLLRTQASGLHMVPQSINLSRTDFDTCDIVEEIRRRVDDAGLSRQLMTIEITESTIGSDFEFMKEQISRFRALGFPVWMDDFGSGYSSLDVLQSIQVDLIKFDIRFMQQFNHEEKSRVILTDMIKLAVDLGVETICEGVERQDQAVFLREVGCAKLQGFYFTRPLTLEQILERYENGTQIGFENPAEAWYFDVIGRINLFDLTAVAMEEKDSLKHYFNSLPMAVIEVLDDKARFIRSNQAYRDFFERTFHESFADMSKAFGEMDAEQGSPLVAMLQKCCAEDGLMVFDETMPDGTTIHSFMRYIATNPVNGTMAAAVAVLAITNIPGHLNS